MIPANPRNQNGGRERQIRSKRTESTFTQKWIVPRVLTLGTLHTFAGFLRQTEKSISMRKRRPRRGFDEAWKYAVRVFFPECLKLLFPSVHAQIDWTLPVEFLNADLYRLAPGARSKRRQTADIVVKVYFLDGRERIVLIHIEIQAQPDPNFPLRMFVYYYHIFDDYGYLEVVSLAILADNDSNWRPGSFQRSTAGCRVAFEFPTVKLARF